MTTSFSAVPGTVLTSSWLLVDQARIDRFAEATGDHQFIHVDPVRAAETPFGGTIAHGLLTLSLLPSLADATLPVQPGTRMGVNYGYDRIRFLSPVRAGRRIRAHFTIVDHSERAPRQWQYTIDVSVEIEDEAKPALIARALSLVYVD